MTESTHSGVLDVRLSGDRVCRAEDLAGFSKKVGHSVPVRIDDHADALLAQWADPWVNERANALHQALRAHFGFKRSEFDFRKTTGAIELGWPVARARFWAEWIVETPPRVLMRVEIKSAGKSDLLGDAALMAILSGLCDTVRVRPPAGVSVEDLIDRIESNPENAKSLDYPPDAISLRFTPPPGSVEFSANAESWCFRALSGADIAEISAKASTLLAEWISPAGVGDA